MTTVVQPARRPDIQGLRAVAVLMVVAFHAGAPVPGGFAGVDVFFVISGFVITAMLVREHVATGRIRLSRFYVRRIRRLTPALAVMVFVTVALSLILLSPLQTQAATFNTALGALLLFANYAVAKFTGGYFDVAASSNPLLHTWTLSLEEQFYLIFPAMLILGWWLARRSGRRGAVVAVVAALGVVSLGVAMATAAGVVLPLVPDGFVGFYGPLGRAWEFAAGAVLALIVPHLKPLSRTQGLIACILGIVALAVTLVAVSEKQVFPGPATLIPVIGTLLLLLGGTSANPISSALSWRPVVAIGDLSYSWYLWHWPLIVFTTLLWPGQPVLTVAAAVFSLVPAYVSYRWLEVPFRTRTFSRRRLTTLVAVVLAPPLALTAFGLVESARGYGIPGVQDALAAQGPHAGFLAGCMSADPVDDASASTCVWNAAATGAPVYLIGDSIADHYSEGLIAAATEVGRPLTITVAAGCPAYSIVLPHDGHSDDVTADDGCGPYESSVQSWLADQPPGLVVIGETDSAWWQPSPAIPPGTEPFIVSDAVKAAAIEKGLRDLVGRLQAAGHTVVLSMAPPSYRFPMPSWDPNRCTIWQLAARTCAGTRTVEDLDVLQGPMRDIIRRIANDTGAGILDLRDHFCPDGICSTSRDGHMIYLDAIHISVEESKALTPTFVQLLKDN